MIIYPPDIKYLYNVLLAKYIQIHTANNVIGKKKLAEIFDIPEGRASEIKVDYTINKVRAILKIIFYHYKYKNPVYVSDDNTRMRLVTWKEFVKFYPKTINELNSRSLKTNSFYLINKIIKL